MSKKYTPQGGLYNTQVYGYQCFKKKSINTCVNTYVNTFALIYLYAMR